MLALANFCPTKQTKDYTCGPACARSVLNFTKGLDLPEELLARDCRTSSRDGTTPANLARALWKYHVAAKVAPLDRKLVMWHLHNDKPVPILWGDWSKGGHWVVVIGYDPKKRTFLMADPSAPTGLRCHKWSTLDRYWQATIRGHTYKRCGILITKAAMTNPRTRAPKGGTTGVNNEFYEGGKFLPSKADRAKQAPAHLAAGRKAEIAPGQWENRPEDWTVPVWGRIKVFVDHHHLRRTSSARINTDLPEVALESHGGRKHIQEGIDLFNRGVRWIYTGDHPKAGQPL